MPADKPLVAVDARHLKSGIGTYLSQLLPHMCQDDRFCWRLLGPPALDKLSSETVSWIPCEEPIYTVREHFLIPDLAAGADLLWVPQYNAPFMWGGRLVITLHDMIHRLPEYPRPLFKSLASRLVMNRSVRRSSRVITVSEYSRQRILEFYPQQSAKISVIHNGVLQPASVEGEPPVATPYILSMGNALAHKNFPRLIEAFASVKDKIPHQLVIAGHEGEDREVMERLARLQQGRVSLLGSQSQQDWARLMSHADLYVCPSLEEGFGMPPLEALALGVPVAVARAASLPEVLGEAAFWFDPRNVQDMSDTLLDALSNTPMRQHVVGAGELLVTKYSWQKSAREHLQVLWQALQ